MFLHAQKFCPPSTLAYKGLFARKPEEFLVSGNPDCVFRIIISSLRVPLSELERLLFIQLDGNLRLGQSGVHHEDLSGIQVEN